MAFGAVLEVVSLGSVIPFLGAITSPDTVYHHKYFRYFIEIANIKSSEEIIMPVTLIFIFISVFAGIYRVFQLKQVTKFTFSIGHDISSMIYTKIIAQPLSTHINQNSSEIISGITVKVNSAVWSFLSILLFFSSTVVLTTVITTLIIINPIASIITFVASAVIYGSISYFTKEKLEHNSAIVANMHNNTIKIVQESIGGIRDIILNKSHSYFTNEFNLYDKKLKNSLGYNVFIGGAPKYAMESIGMVSLALLALYFSKSPGGISSSIPFLGALAVGLQRMIPTMQQIYNSWVSLKGHQASLRDVLNFLGIVPAHTNSIQEGSKQAIEFEKTIELNNVSFRYSEKSEEIFTNLNIKIIPNSIIGIIGETGSGKSTLVDLIMGLLLPTKGEVLVDGVSIHSDILNWHKKIAHVPQGVFLAALSIIENIAFGIDKDKISFERVVQSAKLAGAHSFIENTKMGYNTVVGERGSSLSGGQIQRIGIARALYKKAKLIVLDESTSAIDKEMEKNVFQSLINYKTNQTILIISHNPSTLSYCDYLIDLNSNPITLISINKKIKDEDR